MGFPLYSVKILGTALQYQDMINNVYRLGKQNLKTARDEESRVMKTLTNFTT